LALPLAFLSVQAQGVETKPGTASVSGRVLLKGEPVQGVTVVLQPQVSGRPANPDAVLRGRTDGSGRFQITGVAAGRHSITAFWPGAISQDDMSFTGMPGKTLNVAEGENVENIDLALRPGGVITGRVTDSQGRPLVDERITLDRLDSQGRWQQYYGSPISFETFTTDDRGTYRIYGLSGGKYRVSVGHAQASGSGVVIMSRAFYPKTFHPDATDESQAKATEVVEGDETTNVDITVGETKRTYDLYGRVVNAETGQPVAGVEIGYGSFRDGRMVSSTSSGERSRANGEFRLIGVMPGKYGVFARSQGDGDFISDPVTCEIGEGDVHGIEIKVRQGGSISGVVVIEGANDPNTLSRLSQISLRAFTRPSPGMPPPPVIGGMGGMIRVNADGSFRIRGLQQGKVQISMMPVPGLVLTRIELNGAPQRDGIDLNPGEHITGVKIAVARGTLSLRGEVKIIGATLPQGQRLFVSARRTDQSVQSSSSAEVDARGQFTLENLAPGEYEVRISPIFNPNSGRPDPQVMRAFSEAKHTVNLSAGNQAPITLVVKEGQKEGDK
ncbi:MAG: carboxypeptidase regulatory-like domain-containing protein, partial [Blastocatellia bacterium]